MAFQLDNEKLTGPGGNAKLELTSKSTRTRRWCGLEVIARTGITFQSSLVPGKSHIHSAEKRNQLVAGASSHVWVGS
jgi:hypothetical protein